MERAPTLKDELARCLRTLQTVVILVEFPENEFEALRNVGLSRACICAVSASWAGLLELCGTPAPGLAAAVCLKMRRSQPHRCFFLIHGCASRSKVASGTSVTSLVNELRAELQSFLLPRQILVITGAPSGLETELADDIKIACSIAQLDDAQVERLFADLTSGIYKSLFTVDAPDTRFQLIPSPTRDEFERAMEQVITECSARSVTIIYCGHGAYDGTLSLHDMQYSGADLADFLAAHELDHYPETKLFLNSCFALHFLARMRDCDVDVLVSQLDGLVRICSPELKGKVREVLEAADSDSHDLQRMTGEIFSTLLTADAFRIDSRHEPSRGPFSCPWGSNTIWCWPLSIQTLKATGALRQVYNLAHRECTPPMKVALTRANWYHDRGSCLLALPLQPAAALHSSVPCPQLLVFQAGHGDSLLFRWKDANILIDGGFQQNPPPFWSVVSRLLQVDVAVLTHADCDHVNGMLPWLQRKVFEAQNGREDSPAICRAVFIAAAKGRGWAQAGELHGLWRQYKGSENQLISQPVAGQTIFQKDWKDGTSVKLICVLPTQQRRDEATARIKPFTRLSLLNLSSLALLLLCRFADGSERRYLFTGDADGFDVVTSLKHLGLPQTFYCVDMPHHGSSENHPSEFLSGITAEKIVVSTNGTQSFHHPDADTLSHLEQYLLDHPSAKVYFNYHDHEPHTRSDRVNAKHRRHQVSTYLSRVIARVTLSATPYLEID